MIVITGATGNTGKIATQELLAKGEKVRVVGRSAQRLEPFAKKGAEPFTCDLRDAASVTRAFQGARTVYVMIPPDMTQADLRAHQESVSDALAGALEKAGVTHAVCLSSIGAHRAERVGPINGLHSFEQKIRQIAALNALILRPAFFMENHFPQIPLIQKMGTMVGLLKPDLPIAQIATRDIGRAAAEALARPAFAGKQTRELLGQRDVSMKETAAILGKALGKTSLGYSQMPAAIVEAGMRQAGMPEKWARLMAEMFESMNNGWLAAAETRSPGNTTPTSLETFATEEFLPRFQNRAASA